MVFLVRPAWGDCLGGESPLRSVVVGTIFLQEQF